MSVNNRHTCVHSVLIQPFWFSLSVCVLSRCCRVQLFVTLWTVAHRAPLSLEFSRQEYWSGLQFHKSKILQILANKMLTMFKKVLYTTTQFNLFQVSFKSQRKVMPKNAQTTTQLHSSHMLVNQCSKSPSQASATCEL